MNSTINKNIKNLLSQRSTNGLFNQLQTRRKPTYKKIRYSFIIFTYGTILITLILSVSLTNYVFDGYSLFEAVIMIIMVLLYSSSSIGMLGVIFYIRINTLKSYESIMKKNIMLSSKAIFSLKAEGISRYLKGGVFIIGLASILFSLLQLDGDFRHIDPNCRLLISIYFRISQAIFFLIQIYFIVFYNSLIVLKHCMKAKVLFTHIIFVNICTWIKVSLSKITKIYPDQNSKSCNLMVTTDLALYFLPCVSEYSIISVAVIYDIIHRIGKLQFTVTNEKDVSIYYSLHKSLIGIIIGSLFVLITLEIFFGFMSIDVPDYFIQFHNVEEIIFYAIGLVSVTYLLQRTRLFPFSFPYYTNTMEINLLFVSTFFSIMYCLQLLLFCTQFLIAHRDHTELTFVRKSVIFGRIVTIFGEMFNIIAQTFVITDCFHRCIEDSNVLDEINKPGQNIIISLIGINLSLWIMKSFQIKKGDIFFNGIMFLHENNDPYNVIVQFFLFINLPISILYRYHCTVCFANIFTKMYQFEMQRIGAILRDEEFSYAQLTRSPTRLVKEFSKKLTQRLSENPYDDARHLTIRLP